MALFSLFFCCYTWLGNCFAVTDACVRFNLVVLLFCSGVVLDARIDKILSLKGVLHI